MNTRNIIGAIIAIIGVGVALMTPDDCKNTLLSKDMTTCTKQALG